MSQPTPQEVPFALKTLSVCTKVSRRILREAGVLPPARIIASDWNDMVDQVALQHRGRFDPEEFLLRDVEKVLIEGSQ